jgi:hypothetical protein
VGDHAGILGAVVFLFFGYAFNVIKDLGGGNGTLSELGLIEENST